MAEVPPGSNAPAVPAAPPEADTPVTVPDFPGTPDLLNDASAIPSGTPLVADSNGS